MKLLIVEEDWYNIPAPIRVTCEGIISFQERMTNAVLYNSELAQKKA